MGDFFLARGNFCEEKMTKGITCSNCGHKVQIPSLCSMWISKSDPDRGCMITGINDMEGIVWVQSFIKNNDHIRYEFRNNKPMEHYMSIDFLFEKYERTTYV